STARQPSHVAECVSRYFGDWPKRVVEKDPPERGAPRTDQSVVAKRHGQGRRDAVGILALGPVRHRLPAAVCREAVVDVTSTYAPVDVRQWRLRDCRMARRLSSLRSGATHTQSRT